MKPLRRVFLVGGALTPFIGKSHPDFMWKGHADFGKRENPTLEEYFAQVLAKLFAETGLEPARIEKGYVGNFAGELFNKQGHLGSMLARVESRLEGVPFTRVEGACASGALAMIGAIEAIQAGRNITLAIGAEAQTTVSAREGADFLARASHYETERGLDDFTFPAMFARRTMHCRAETGVTEEDVAHVVVKAYANAAKNPNAHMKAVPMTFEQAATANDRNPTFLKNPDLSPFLKISDCSQVSDGAAAMVLASEEGLRALGLSPDDAVEVLSYAQSNGALGQVSDFTRMGITERAAKEAYADTGLTAGDIKVAEVHDCFAITELLMTEALGFAAHGQGGALAREGRTAIGGDIPVNTGGGLLAFGHPVGATGIKQVLEVARQMQKRCGDYQVGHDIKHGIAANMGGDDRTAVVTILRNNAAV